MTCARSNMKKPEPAKQTLDQRKLIGNFKLSFESLNDNGQSTAIEVLLLVRSTVARP
jgi:hypothetical protein